MKRDCIGKSFKPIINFYCYNCHGFGHKEVDCKKPKFDSNNSNSRMFRDTYPAGNERRKSSRKYNEVERSNKTRSNIVCYKCNNFEHIARNCRAPVNHNEPNQRRSTPVCQLCNDFGHIARFCRMDMRNINMIPNFKRNNNINIRRNDSNNNSQQDELREHVEEFKEILVKEKDPSSSQIVLKE